MSPFRTKNLEGGNKGDAAFKQRPAAKPKINEELKMSANKEKLTIKPLPTARALCYLLSERLEMSPNKEDAAVKLPGAKPKIIEEMKMSINKETLKMRASQQGGQCCQVACR